MNKVILCLVALLVVVSIIGCTKKQEEAVRGVIEEHKEEIEAGIKETVQEANCQSFNGYLCSEPDDCALPYLDTIESYCCPIKCRICNESCDDRNECTTESCSKETNYSCVFTKIRGSCQNDGYCDSNEAQCFELNVGIPTEYSVTSEGFCGAYASSTGVGGGKCDFRNMKPGEPNVDCPSTCNDGDSTTFDRYDVESQSCQHIPLCGDGDATTGDWFDLEINECKHCKLPVVE